MRIVLFGHARIGMTKLLGDDTRRNAAHGERRAVRMAEQVKEIAGLNLETPKG